MWNKLKNALKRFKAWTAPVRHPWRHVQKSMGAGIRKAVLEEGEIGLLMDHLVRELVRLQDRIDLLQETIERIAAAEERPPTPDAAEAMPVRTAPSGYLKAG